MEILCGRYMIFAVTEDKDVTDVQAWSYMT